MKVILNSKINPTEYVGTGYAELMQPGKIYDVMIREHSRANPETAYYLIDIGVEQKSTYVTDTDVLKGEYIRTFRDPRLEKNYRMGTYIWIESYRADPLSLNNKEAAGFLQSTDAGDIFYEK